MSAREANYDGLVGPTHNFGGLSAGNLASQANEGLVSNPRAAALQGLTKMKRLADRGLLQGVLPPHERPYLPLLRGAGFAGSDEDVIEAAWARAPQLVRQACSASAMWAANAATVSPSADARDGRLHLTPANLQTMLHRSIEAEQTRRALNAAFPEEARFVVHAPLPAHDAFSDEGAANHVRLCKTHGAPGVELFVDGRGPFDRQDMNVPARQSRLAGEAIVRAHGLDQARCVFIRQSRAAMEAGAFHNDVVCVGALSTLFVHEQAFEEAKQAYAAIRTASDGLFEPQFVIVPASEVSLSDAIGSYLFNSQLLEMPNTDRLVLIAPIECQENEATRRYCETLISGNGPIGAVEFVDVRQSMRNGGGPACLRLRIVLTDAEQAAANASMVMNDDLYARLSDWVERRYRDRLAPDDLGDPALVTQTREALDELTGLLALGDDFYPFQRAGA